MNFTKKMIWALLLFLKEKLPSFLFFFCPVKKDKILFINFNGRGFGCNPKYIAEEILNQKLDLDLVWLINNPQENLPQGIRKVPFHGICAIYELATSKIIVTNVKNDLRLVKKKNQYVIQTWHASYTSKKVEREAEDKLSPKYLKESKKNSRQTDLFLSNSKILSECYRDAFWCTCEIMECGFPRNDMLFPENKEEQVLQIKSALGLPADSKLALYAPTFRDDGSTECYAIDCKGILDTLNANTDTWYLLVRLHPNVGKADGLFPFSPHIIDTTPYPDMQELLLASDILITDYSSTVFEFAAMEKPSFIFANDVEAYDKLRGIKDDFYKMPYPVCTTNEELLECLKQYSPESGKKAAKEFMTLFGSVDNGTASKQVVNRIKDVILGKIK